MRASVQDGDFRQILELGGPSWSRSFWLGALLLVRTYLIVLRLIVEAVHANRIRITDHADEEALADQISIGDVLKNIATGEIIEQYPSDKPYPSCLIYNQFDGHVHSVWAYNQKSSWAVLITVYRPDPQRWINWRVRRTK